MRWGLKEAGPDPGDDAAGLLQLTDTVSGMSYPSELTDEQWALLGPVSNAPGKRGPKHAPDLRRVVDAMLPLVTRRPLGASADRATRGCPGG